MLAVPRCPQFVHTKVRSCGRFSIFSITCSIDIAHHMLPANEGLQRLGETIRGHAGRTPEPAMSVAQWSGEAWVGLGRNPRSLRELSVRDLDSYVRQCGGRAAP